MIVSSRITNAQNVKACAQPDTGRLNSLRWANTSTIWALIAPARSGRRSGGISAPAQTNRPSHSPRAAEMTIATAVTSRPAMRRAVTGGRLKEGEQPPCDRDQHEWRGEQHHAHDHQGREHPHARAGLTAPVLKPPEHGRSVRRWRLRPGDEKS